MVKKNIFFVEP